MFSNSLLIYCCQARSNSLTKKNFDAAAYWQRRARAILHHLANHHRYQQSSCLSSIGSSWDFSAQQFDFLC